MRGKVALITPGSYLLVSLCVRSANDKSHYFFFFQFQIPIHPNKLLFSFSFHLSPKVGNQIATRLDEKCNAYNVVLRGCLRHLGATYNKQLRDQLLREQRVAYEAFKPSKSAAAAKKMAGFGSLDRFLKPKAQIEAAAAASASGSGSAASGNKSNFPSNVNNTPKKMSVDGSKKPVAA